jgi:hypothetical protein
MLIRHRTGIRSFPAASQALHPNSKLNAVVTIYKVEQAAMPACTNRLSLNFIFTETKIALPTIR